MNELEEHIDYLEAEGCAADDEIIRLNAEVKELSERLEKAEGALRYYADPKNWEYKNVGETVYIEMCPIQSDKGETASRALGERDD